MHGMGWHALCAGCSGVATSYMLLPWLLICSRDTPCLPLPLQVLRMAFWPAYMVQCLLGQGSINHWQLAPHTLRSLLLLLQAAPAPSASSHLPSASTSTSRAAGAAAAGSWDAEEEGAAWWQLLMDGTADEGAAQQQVNASTLVCCRPLH